MSCKVFPFLPGDRVFICPGTPDDGSVLFPIIVRNPENEAVYVFKDYELGKEMLVLYIREGLWRYNFGSLSDGYYYFSGSCIDDSDCNDPFRPHLH